MCRRKHEDTTQDTRCARKTLARSAMLTKEARWENRKETTVKHHATVKVSKYESLREDFDDVWRRRKKSRALVTLLVEMLEAGALELCHLNVPSPHRYWTTSGDGRFTDRHLLIDHVCSATIADLFLAREIVFTTDADSPPEVRWSVLPGSVN